MSAEYDDQGIVDAEIEPSQSGTPHKATAGAMVTKQYQMMPAPSGLAPGSTVGLSELKLTVDERAIVRRPIDRNREVAIRPDGIIYVPGNVVRTRLQEAFGPGEWALRQERDPWYDPETDECAYDGSLWIHGKFAARAIGGCKWRPKNAAMAKSDAIEGAKTDCLHRCCKDLGICTEVWDMEWRAEWLAEFAEPYTGSVWDWKSKSNKNKVLYRKKGTALTGEALANAVSIIGEFPIGFGPDTRVIEGPDVGKALKDVSDENLAKLEKASLVEWRLSAKAEKVRRMNEAIKAQQAGGDAPAADSVEEVLAGDTESA